MSKVKITLKTTNIDEYGKSVITREKLTVPMECMATYEKCGVMGNFGDSKEDIVSILLTFRKVSKL